MVTTVPVPCQHQQFQKYSNCPHCIYCVSFYCDEQTMLMIKIWLIEQVIDKPGEDKNTKGMSIAVVSISTSTILAICTETTMQNAPYSHTVLGPVCLEPSQTAMNSISTLKKMKTSLSKSTALMQTASFFNKKIEAHLSFPLSRISLITVLQLFLRFSQIQC